MSTEFVKVTEVEHYTDTLFRIRTERPPGFKFTAGEFVMIGMGDNDTMRAYSITAGPQDNFLEFYSIKVPDGPLTSRLQHIQVDDHIEIGTRTTGTLTLANITSGGNLWLLGTGTGISPFISILRDPSTTESYASTNVMWSVRNADELHAYTSFLESNTDTFVPIVTRDKDWTGENRRITNISNFNPDTDRIMLCGSMEFNHEMSDILTQSGFVHGTRRARGTFVVEKAFVS